MDKPWERIKETKPKKLSSKSSTESATKSIVSTAPPPTKPPPKQDEAAGGTDDITSTVDQNFENHGRQEPEEEEDNDVFEDSVGIHSPLLVQQNINQPLEENQNQEQPLIQVDDLLIHVPANENMAERHLINPSLRPPTFSGISSDNARNFFRSFERYCELLNSRTRTSIRFTSKWTCPILVRITS